MLDRVTGPGFGEDGRRRVTGDTSLGDGVVITIGGSRPETTFAKDRGLEGGVVSMAAGGPSWTETDGGGLDDWVEAFRGHFLASWPETPHRKQERTCPR